MKLLDFQMPPFARTAWVSKSVKDEWEPKSWKASHAYAQLELETVIYGIRDCTTGHIPNENMAYELSKLAEKGLMFLPIQRVGVYSGFAHTHPPVVEGRPWNWYGVIAREPKHALAFKEASQGPKIDHETIGKLLGYPKCCMDFFNNVWAAGYIDPVWQQAENIDKKYLLEQNEHLIRLSHETPFVTNVMLRYIGLRIVPHIPCSSHCEATHKFANKWLELGKKLKLDGIEELEQFLRLPVKWDCLKGIAYVSTPLFKIETNSMTCYPNYIVERKGTFYPKYLPRGNAFPHRMELSVPKEVILAHDNN